MKENKDNKDNLEEKKKLTWREKRRKKKEKKKDQKKEEKTESKGKLKFKYIFLTLLFVGIVIGGYIGYTELYIPSVTEHSIEIYGENNTLYDKLTFKKDSYIRVLDEEEKEDRVIKLEEGMDKLILEDMDNTDNSIFKSWEFKEKLDEKEEFYKRDIIYFNASPVFEDKQDYILTFKADDDKADILNKDDDVVSFIRKGYKKNSNINDYLPKLDIEKDFKGDWYINNNKINKDTEIKRDTELVFKTYQDKNDNGIDDFTERFDIDFVSNVKEQFESVNVGWEETIDLPVIVDENRVFYEWYEDKNFYKEFTEDTKITNDLTLYAKIKTYHQVINETVDDPINRKDIYYQVKRMLDRRNKAVDEKYKKEIEEAEAERKARIRELEEENKTEIDTEIKIDIHNTKHEKLFLITFLDPLNDYIYSVIAPYGQTIKVVNSNGQLSQEYSVRQHSSIILDESKLVPKGKELDQFHSEYRKINETVFIKIQPLVK